MLDVGCIYCWRNSVNGKRYIGQTVKLVDERLKQHILAARAGSERPICRAIRMHGEAAFVLDWVETIEIHDVDVGKRNIKTTLDLAEYVAIRLFDTFRGEGYNATEGGDGGDGGDRELHRRRCSSKLWLGMKDRPIEYAKLCTAKLLIEDPDEFRRRCGKGDHRHGLKSTPRSGVTAPKPVMCVELGLIFRSRSDAVRQMRLKGYTVHANHMRSCLLGKRKRSGGFHWKYVENT